MPNPLRLLLAVLWLGIATASAAPFSTNANRLTYLDEDNPFYPHRDFPRLITPQWIGEPGVEAVVILAIDDMREAKKYETFLRPILDRLKKIDGRAPVSIFANLVTTNDTAQLQTWLAEGLSLEVHTLTHPCPLLQKGSFTNAWNTFHGCVDLLGKIPGNQPVAFRMPCCDSMNSPSPRFYAEIFNRTSPEGRFLQADSSVMCLLTDDFLKRHGVPPPKPPEHPATSSPSPPSGERAGERGQTPPSPNGLPPTIVAPPPHPHSLSPGRGEGGQARAAADHFRRYFPTATNAVTKKSLANFGTYIEDYPYPYVINRTCWEFPAMVPSDWEAFNAHGPTNAATVADWQLALDAVVRAQGVFTSVFHPHGWLRNDQIIQFIDYAERTYGKKVKFLTFKEAVARLNKNLLLRTPLWETGGYIQSVRLLDQNNDGYMDLVINHPTGGSAVRTWNATESRWEELYDPSRGRNVPSILWTQPRLHDGKRSTGCFGSIPGLGDTLMLNWICSYDFDQQTAWTFREGKWGKNRDAFTGLHRFVGHDDDCELYPGKVRVVLRDIDRDGKCELIGGDPSKTAICSWSDAERSWKKLSYALPAGLALVNERGEDNGLRFVDLNGDGFDDLILSNEKEYAIHLWAKTVKPGLGWAAGWSHKVLHEQRGRADLPVGQNAPPTNDAKAAQQRSPATATPTNHLSLITNYSREIPPFVRSGPHRNNGAWFARGQLFIQNEDTAHLPDNVWRKTFAELIAFDTPPPKTPAESQQCFQVRPGFRVELVAAEPLVQSPVAFEWGADGKLWVVEMGDYPNGVPEHEARASSPSPFVGRGERAGVRGGGRVKFLEDLDSDGRYDRATVFLDNLPFPTGVMPWRKGVLISAAPDILYAEDTDGDGKADVVKVLFTGFREGNQQHRVNGFELGLDNWIYGANGDSGGTITFVSTTASSPSPPSAERAGVRGQTPLSPKGSPTTSAAPSPHPQSLSPAGGEGGPLRGSVNISGRDFRFRPDTGEFEAIEGQTQFGRRRDDWGNWFGNNNPNWLWHYWLPDRYLRRNPHLAVKSSKQVLANYPDSTRCFPISTPPIRFNQPQSVNHVTSGCSPAPYRDDLFGPGFATSVFISEPVHNLVHREVLVPDGVSFTSRRAYDEQDREFLASTDNWFRPTMLKTGPDGALYIADFYRFVLEHPEWIAPETQARLDLRAGADKGRIWRVVPVDKPARKIPNLAKLSTLDLVLALESPSGWQRDTAQRLLVERQDKAAVEGLKKLAVEAKNPKARVQALCSLEGMSAASRELLTKMLNDDQPGMREQALRLAEPFLRNDDEPPQLGKPTLRGAVLSQRHQADTNPRLAFQLALALGEWSVADPEMGAGVQLGSLAVKYAADAKIMVAVMSSAPRDLGHMAGYLGIQSRGSPVLEEVLKLIGARADEREIAKALLTLFHPGNFGDTPKFGLWEFSNLAGFLDGMDQASIPVAKAQSAVAKESKWLESAFNTAFEQARTTSVAGSLSTTHRQSAIRLLGRSPSGRTEDLATLATLLKPQHPAEIQSAAVAQLAKLGGTDSAAALLADWKAHSPTLRDSVLSALLSRPAWIEALLTALERGQVAVTQISPAQRQKLTTHPQPAIRDRATKLFATTSADRAKVIKDYAAVDTLKGDTARGRELFTKNCATCHRLKNEGREIGPDLGQTATRDTDWLLTAILDPNAAVEARYLGYTAITKSGNEYSGIITAETPNNLVLKSSDGTETPVLRTDLKELLGSGLSLMPEGLEAVLKPQDLADLLAWLRAK